MSPCGAELHRQPFPWDCGRDVHYWTPPAQIRTCGFPAYGSLGCLTAKRSLSDLPYVAQRLGHAFPVLCRRVLCCPAFPSASALRSTGSAAGRPALFVGFAATMAESDFPCSCIIGFGSSPSRAGPRRVGAAGQTWGLPGSDVIPLCVMGSSTSAERRPLA